MFIKAFGFLYGRESASWRKFLDRKKTAIIFVGFFILFFPYSSARAEIMIENAFLIVNVNVIDGDNTFDFKLQPEVYNWNAEEIDFSAETYEGFDEQVSRLQVNNTYYLNSVTSEGWQLASSSCETESPYNTTSETLQGTKVTVGDYSNVTCNFTYKKNEEKKVPVIIVPGIISSYLNKNEPGSPEAWPSLLKMAVPGEDSYLYDLAMNDSGWPNYNNLQPTDIFRTVGNKDIFSGLIAELEKTGYQENKDLFVFPYDWRLNVAWLAGDSPMPNTATLKAKIDQVLASTGADKVDIIAHSMGGLIAKTYMQKYGSDKIDKFVDIATPHLGAPYALKMLMFGDSMGFSYFGFGANEFTMKSISLNMPAIYDLLPSQAYQKLNSGNNSNFIGDVYDLDHDGIKGDLSYVDTQKFMFNVGLNSALLTEAQELHSKIDNFNIDNTYNIIGCGVPTVGKLYILNKEKSGGYEYGLKYLDGDGTVPLKSADQLNTSQKYFLRGTVHGVMSSASGVKQLVAATLGNNPGSFNLGDYPKLSTSNSICGISGQAISFHSPIKIDVYDAAGNHAGPDVNGDLENNLTGVTYDLIEGNKFIFLPVGRQFRVEGQAIASGSFNARFQTIEDNQYVSEAYFNEIPLTTSTKITINDPTQKIISYDATGDGQMEQIIKPSAELDTQAMQDLIKPTTNLQVLGQLGVNGWYLATATVGLLAIDDNGGAGVLKTEYKINNDEWRNYVGQLSLGNGIHNLVYESTDRAGNIEEPKNVQIKVDSQAPVISAVYPNAETPVLHSETVPILYSLSDAASGLATDSVRVEIDGQKINSTQLDLFSLKIGSHLLTISANDLAGNKAFANTTFSVVANYDSLIKDIQRLYQMGAINKESAKNSLIKDVENLDKTTEKYQQRIIDKQKYFKKISDKCLTRYKSERCTKLVNAFDELIFCEDMRWDNKVTRQYADILSNLENFRKKGWVDLLAYDIIKENINYLAK